MKSFNLIAFVLAGLGSLFAMPETKIDSEALKSDTAAVAAYVALAPSPATPVPTPTIKILPVGDVGEPADTVGGIRLQGSADPAGSLPDKPASPVPSDITLEAPPTSPAPPPVAPPAPVIKAAPVYEWQSYDVRWRPGRGLRRCFGGRCSG